MRKLFLLAQVLFFAGISSTYSQITLPPRFNNVLVAAGITMPTTMAFAPDGRIFIAEETGKLKVWKNGAVLPKPFVNLAVNTNGERGLLGVALDPSFPSNHFIYLCYTIPNGSFNRVSRFTASGDTAIPGSEQVVIELDTLIANYHTGGHLDFGPDGKLYITTGENGRAILSQNLDKYLGKMLRINTDGSAPADNPFPGPGKRQRVWAYGFRNPFTFTFQPGTGKLFVNDVGEVTWEEINDATAPGGNFGWPHAEGMSADTNYENPVFVYKHGATTVDSGCAITGGTFFNPDTTNYPAQYIGKYFYIDYCGDWINMITSDTPTVKSNFASTTPKYLVSLTTGLDGNLYYMSRNNEAVYKITYSPDSFPTVVTDPVSQTIALGFPVTFSVTASGLPPFNYQWRKNNVNIGAPNSPSYTIPAVALGDSGDYSVIVSNPYGADTSGDAHLTVISNQPPVAVIDTPANNGMYTAGDTIFFHGSATDLEDGTVPDSMFQWLVEFHHNTHIHPGPFVPSATASGSFIIPTVGETSANVWYRLILTVQDNDGLIDSTYIDIYPRTSTLTITTQPPGLNVTLDGVTYTSPYAVLSVEGMVRTIGTSLYLPGTPDLYFTHWNNNGPLTQAISTPINDTAFAAFYDSLQLQYNLGPDTLICKDSSFVLHAGLQYNSFAWNDGSVGESVIVNTSVEDTLTFSVTVTNSNNETGHDSITVIVQICNDVAEVPMNLVRIFPVPSTGEITVRGIPNNYDLRVTDVAGRIIFEERFVNNSGDKIYHLSPGIYSFSVSSMDGSVQGHRKVIVIR